MSKKFLMTVIVFFALSVITITLISCSSESDKKPSEPANILPYLEILTPDSLTIGYGSIIRIQAKASDEDGTIEKVSFCIGESIYEVTIEPYICDLSSLELNPGSAYSVNVIAVDNDGGEIEASISFSVGLTEEKIVTVLFPAGGEVLEVGNILKILWSDNISENLKIDLWKGESIICSLSEEQLVTEGIGEYDWLVSFDSLVSGTDYFVKVYSASDPSVYGESGYFSIFTGPVIVVISPDGGEFWVPGHIEMVQWVDNIDEKVRIELYKNGVFNSVITDSVESNGSYEWLIPVSIVESNDYKIKIISVKNDEIFAESSSYFCISSSPMLNLISPNGSEIWNAGAARDIKWSSNITENVKIELHKGGNYYKTIIDSAENNGLYKWEIPPETPLDSDYKIIISLVSDTEVSDISSGFFRIAVPVVMIYESHSNITTASSKVEWYGNSNDETNLTYFYCVTTDTTITDSDARFVLDQQIWNTTQNNSTWISFPMAPYNSDIVFNDEIVYEVDGVSETVKIAYSRLFLYGVDNYGSISEVKSRVFGRINSKPKFPMVFSNKLGVNGFAEYWNTVGPDSAQMVLEEETEYWKAFDFEWMGEDPDGPEVDLEFRWELWERTRLNDTDTYIIKVASSGTDSEWSMNWLNVKFDEEIYNNNPQGQYAFKVWVRDDAFEEADNHATVNFEVYSPTLAKGIILIDDTDPHLWGAPPALFAGNPNPVNTTAFYTELLEEAGYRPEGDMSVDSFYWYKIVKFEGLTDEDGRSYYSPTIRELIHYRLLIVASDDRSNGAGVDFLGRWGFTGYMYTLKDYMTVGGNVFLIGNSILYPKLYPTTPPTLPVNEYRNPLEQMFEADEYDFVDEAEQDYPLTNTNLRVFFSEYFGVYSMTFPEQKTYYTVPGTNTAQYCSDHYYSDNYDFIGIKKYPHIQEETFKNEIRMDSARVNRAWFDAPASGGRIRKHSLKGNGTVFTGVPTFQTFKGENVYEYMSVWDLENDGDYATDGDMSHYLWNYNYVDNVVHTEDGTPVPIIHRTGAVATRYIDEGFAFRTAFFGIPTYFLDDTAGDVRSMFKEMINWFGINGTRNTR